MKKTLIFAGLVVLTTMCGAHAFNNDSVSYANFDTISYDSNYPYASKKESDGAVRMKVATTNYVTARVDEVTPVVTELGTTATSDKDVVVGSNGNGGLKADVAAMGGATCATGGACNGMTSGVETGDRLNAAKTVNPSTGAEDSSNTPSRCTGSVGGYSIAACGFIKNGSARQWIRIIGGVASGS